MGGEVPKGILVISHRAKVHPLGIDIVDITQLLGIDHPFEPVNDGMIFQQVSDHKDATFLGCNLDQLLRLGYGENKWLFHKYILACLQSRLAEWVMRCSRSGDDDRLQVRILQEVLEASGEYCAWQLQPQLFELFLIQITYIFESTFRDLKVIAR